MKLEQINIKSLLRALFQESQYLQPNLSETISYIHWPITTCLIKKTNSNENKQKQKEKTFLRSTKLCIISIRRKFNLLMLNTLGIYLDK